MSVATAGCDGTARCVLPTDNMRDRAKRNRVPRAQPKSRAEAESWIKHHEAQRARTEARIELLTEWLTAYDSRHASDVAA